MNKRHLLEALASVSDDDEIMILDGWNGGGVPRTINLGPVVRTITEADADESADCEDRVGQRVVCLGYGCY